MKYFLYFFICIQYIAVFCQNPSIPSLRIFKSDKSIITYSLKDIDSIVNFSIEPVKLTVELKEKYNPSLECSAKITFNGNDSVTQFGFCWSKTENPTIDSDKLYCKSLDGINFSGRFYSMTKNTKYYIRAFAYNKTGISYSSQIEVTTLNSDDIKIGSQQWNQKNLDVFTFRNGDSITQAKNLKEWNELSQMYNGGKPSWCYYNFDEKNREKYGKLYNWFAVNDSRGLAPNGYHIPSQQEWANLISFLGGGSNASVKLINTSGWAWNAGDNTSEFCALPGGYFDPHEEFNQGLDYIFTGVGLHGYWWTSSTGALNFDEGGRPVAYNVNLLRGNNGPIKRVVDFWRNYGLSVRCIKD
jgi:uncharacterized protein (TIGR02145 family)